MRGGGLKAGRTGAEGDGEGEGDGDGYGDRDVSVTDK